VKFVVTRLGGHGRYWYYQRPSAAWSFVTIRRGRGAGLMATVGLSSFLPSFLPAFVPSLARSLPQPQGQCSMSGNAVRAPFFASPPVLGL
jgi:hypothetical protein